MTPILIVGLGDIGRRVAVRWRARGAQVFGLARSTASASRMEREGVIPLAGDLDRPDSLALPAAKDAYVYHFSPPPPHGRNDPRTRALAEALDTVRPRRLVYISTSGVYGNRGGEWVTEASEPAPATDRARRRLDAEQTLRAWGSRTGTPVVILRVGGIYGPGRLPVARLQRGDPVLRPEACGYTNRIHADDLAEVCVAAAERGTADAIYNVSDGRPGTMTDYFFAVADRLGLPRPPAISMEEARQKLTPAMLSYLTESRRLDNRRLREALGVTLRYPDLETGLAALDPAAELFAAGPGDGGAKPV